MILKQLPLLFTLLLVLASCQKYDLSNDETTKKTSSVNILSRAAEGEALQYPLYAFAFATNGTLIDHQQMNNPKESLRLNIPQQTEARIVVVSADPESYNIPSAPSLSSQITMKTPASSTTTRGYATSPLQMGFIDVNPLSANSTVNIQLHHQTASLKATLENMPSSCTTAYISVASSANAISFDGHLNTDQQQLSRIPLTAGTEASASSFHTLASSEAYIFPTTGNSTTFTIAYNDAQSEQYSSATYNAPLKAGVPYQLNGIYSNGIIALSGSVTPSQWANPVSLNFTFADGGNTTIATNGNTLPDTPASETVEVTSLPTPLSIWKGHIVVAVNENPVPETAVSGESTSSYSLLLLSLSDWGSLTSAVNTTAPTEAFALASNYSEYDLTNWRIPTEDEARLLSQLYRENTSTFDNLITEANADPIALTDDKGSNLRYLCDNAKKTYSYKISTITLAGATVKTYHLRLVCTVNVLVKQ